MIHLGKQQRQRQQIFNSNTETKEKAVIIEFYCLIFNLKTNGKKHNATSKCCDYKITSKQFRNQLCSWVQ